MNLRMHRKAIRDKEVIINGLHQAVVSLTACMESQKELLESLMGERDFYCQVAPRGKK